MFMICLFLKKKKTTTTLQPFPCNPDENFSHIFLGVCTKPWVLSDNGDVIANEDDSLDTPGR